MKNLLLCVTILLIFCFPQTILSQEINNPPNLLKLEREVNVSKQRALLKSQFKLTGYDDLKRIRMKTDDLGIRHEKMQQYYKGVPVDRVTVTVHSKNQKINLVSGNYKEIKNLNVTPRISANTALNMALLHVDGNKYAWEVKDATEKDFFYSSSKEKPKGELTIVTDFYGDATARLAYKFDIFVLDPLNHVEVFIDAHTGSFIRQYALSHSTDVNASGQARYNGNVSFTADYTGSSYRLRQSVDGIETYTLSNQNPPENVDPALYASDITSSSSVFSNQTAVQCHWATEQSHDYFMETHGLDMPLIRSYINWQSNYVNAVNTGGYGLMYGDGDGTSMNALVTIDIVAHEIGHSVTGNSAGLIYQNESGALNESFSDIFGEVVEKFAAGSNNWLLGSEASVGGQGILRSLANPNQYQQPDTYQGTYWYTGSADHGGVHTNSGIQNKWFYILSVGENGTNDNGDSYNVSGIGIDKAAKIAYRNLAVYLTSSSQHTDARAGSIQSAIDLYGDDSAEAIATTNAWYAVGVGAEHSGGGGGGGGGDYCDSQGNNVEYLYIGRVELGAIDNSTSQGSGYTDHTSISTDLSVGGNYTISVTPTRTDNYGLGYSAWIDFNQDGDFEDSGEQVWTQSSTATSPVNGSFTVPAAALNGNTRLRVSGKYDGIPTSCETFDYGEVEDYTVNIQGGSGGGNDYCESQGNNVAYLHIGRVQVGSIDNSSSQGSGYTDYTSISSNLSTNTNYSIAVTATQENGAYSLAYSAWIDYNRDGDFEDSGEQIWTNPDTTDLLVSGSFTVPAGTSGGATRLRISAKNNGIPTSCETFDYGEVEDYTVNIQGSSPGDTQPPTVPSNLSASNTTQTSSTLSWTPSLDNVGVTGYNIYVNGQKVGEANAANAAANARFSLPNDMENNVSQSADIRKCGMNEHMQQLLQNSQYKNDYDKRTAKFDQLRLSANNQASSTLCNSPVRLPVAVHYSGLSNPDSSCLIQLAKDQINILTVDFQAKNSDINKWASAASSFPGINNGATCVEFVLATRNHPSGYGLNDGQVAVTINQVTGDVESSWSGYLNIYVRDIGSGLLGHAPLGGNGNGDGVTMNINAFGAGSGCGQVAPSAPFNLGRTTVHEVGHYLYLNHLWSNDNQEGGCSNDDGVSDTPVQDQPNGGCPANGIQSCGSADLHMSYMDYVNDSCMYMFSAGQSQRAENWISSNLQNLVNNADNVCEDGGGGGSGDDISHTCSDLSPGTTYTLAVSAFDAAGNISGQTSIEVTTQGNGDTQPPSNPANLSTTNTTQTTTTLSWSACTDNIGVAGYNVFVNGNSVGSTSSTSHEIANLSAGITYNVAVSAYDAAGNTSGQSSINVTTLGNGDNQPPTAPTNLSTSNTTETSTHLTWSASTDNVGVTGYNVFVNGSNVGTTDNTFFAVGSLAPNTTYTLAVSAYDVAGNTSGQSSVNVTTEAGESCNPQEIFGIHGFESGWNGWTDGGNDCFRYNSNYYSYQGNWSILLRDNSGTASTMSSPQFDARGYDKLVLDFYIYVYSMENGEDFMVNFYDGSSWHTVRRFTKGVEIFNNQFYHVTIPINKGEYNFPANASVSIQMDASNNYDYLFVDEVKLSGECDGNSFSYAANADDAVIELVSSKNSVPFESEPLEINKAGKELIIHPNPATDYVSISTDIKHITEVKIFSINGTMVFQSHKLKTERPINVSHLPQGIYLVIVETAEGVFRAKLIKS